MKYDLIIKNGTVFDFECRGSSVKDLYIQDGYIVEPDLKQETSADRVVDADGMLVVPGLIDEHAHWAYEIGSLGLNADMICPCSGVTTTVDAGSTGVENFEAFYRSNILRCQTDTKVYLHISGNGVTVTATHEEDQDPGAIDGEKIFRLFDRYPDCLRGLKVRLSQHTMQYGLEPLKAAVRLADDLNAAGHFCTVAVHVANIPKTVKIEEILELLRPGDIYTHPYQNLGPTIFNKDGTVIEAVKKARKRGVLFSSGTGSIHWCLDHMEKAYRDGFFPDFISSDIVDYNVYTRPGFNILYPMCVSLLCGMSVIDIFRAVTVNPARHLGLGKVGELKPGYKADIAIFEVQTRRVKFVDRFGGSADAAQVFVPMMTLKNGKAVFRQIYFDGGYDYSKVEKNFV